jgi:hypothetical protein
MTIYCENAAAAEVLFSLTGGREGRIVSYNPPVEIIVNAKGFIAKVGLIPDNKPRDWSARLAPTTYEKFLPLITDESGELWGYYFGTSGNIQDDGTYTDAFLGSDYKDRKLILYKVKSTRGNETDNLISFIQTWGLVYKYPGYRGKLLPDYFSYIEKISNNNLFLIQDTTGVIYMQQMLNTPNYQVNCISCPPGLSAARGYEDKIACIDCPRVVGGLNKASRRLDNIYG